MNETGFKGLSFTKFFTSTSRSLNAIDLPGDATLDGMVDARDLVALANNWLGSGNWLNGDFDGDGLVDQHDLTLMAQNWQAGVNGAPLNEELANLGPSVNIPEPSALIGVGVSAILLRRRRAIR